MSVCLLFSFHSPVTLGDSWLALVLASIYLYAVGNLAHGLVLAHAGRHQVRIGVPALLGGRAPRHCR